MLRKGWCRLGIIDFAFSDLEHKCSGFLECAELQYVWQKSLELEKVWPVTFVLQQLQADEHKMDLSHLNFLLFVMFAVIILIKVYCDEVPSALYQAVLSH